MNTLSKDDRTKNFDLDSNHEISYNPLNNFFVEGGGPNINDLLPFLRQFWSDNANELNRKFNNSFELITNKLRELLRRNVLPNALWEAEMIKIVEQVNQQFSLYSGGENGMDTEQLYIKFFEKMLYDLKPIETIDDESPTSFVSQDDIVRQVNEIRDEVKKGNRLSFKLLQELQVMLEEFAHSSANNEKEDIKGVITENKNYMVGFLNLAIKAIDSMDLIYHSAMKTSLKEWGEQINKITDDFLMVLESFGIEEIKALGEYIDGNTMISIGNIPSDANPQLERFQVYAVNERGFRFKETGEVIREAKVITIY